MKEIQPCDIRAASLVLATDYTFSESLKYYSAWELLISQLSKNEPFERNFALKAIQAAAKSFPRTLTSLKLKISLVKRLISIVSGDEVSVFNQHCRITRRELLLPLPLANACPL